MKQLAFTFTRKVVLDSIWYDEGWHTDMAAEGMTDEEALRTMLQEGYEEDPLSMWEEILGGMNPTDRNAVALVFAAACTDVDVVDRG